MSYLSEDEVIKLASKSLHAGRFDRICRSIDRNAFFHFALLDPWVLFDMLEMLG
jgi:hypothetical protein